MNPQLPETIERWLVGFSGAGQHDGVIALTADDLAHSASGNAPRLGLHEAMRAAELPRARAVRLRLPAFRGKSLIGVLSWLVTERLATADAEVSWYLEKQQGPNSCAALLTELGWRAVDRHREGKLVRIVGSPPERADLPEPRRFSAVLGSAELSFAADYGVFSPGHVDEGTMLLAEVALRHPPVDALADIGVGYGPLAVGLLRNGVAERAVGTDVDCLALWLAERNAGHNGVAIRTVCSPDPRDVELTPLTVCNVPTHIDAARSAELMTALAQRAGGGRDLMVVVHASLERRYTRHLVDAGLAPTRQPGAAHVVLTATG